MALKIKFHQTWWIAGGKNGINGAFSLLLMTRSLPEGRSHHVPHEGATEQVQREAQPFAAFLLAPPPSGFGMFYWTLLTRLRNRGTQVTLQTPVKSTFYSCMTVFMADQVLGCISPTSQCLGFCRGYGLLCALRVVKLPSPCARQFWREARAFCSPSLQPAPGPDCSSTEHSDGTKELGLSCFCAGLIALLLIQL